MSEAENPPAFPVPWEYAANETGMSLRDWFAGQALAGFIAEGAQREIDAACRAEPDFLDKGPEARARIVNDQVAWGCYSLADAMLSARQHTRAEPDLVEAAKRIRRHIQHDQSCPHPRNGCGCTCGMIDDDNALRAALTRADV